MLLHHFTQLFTNFSAQCRNKEMKVKKRGHQIENENDNFFLLFLLLFGIQSHSSIELFWITCLSAYAVDGVDRSEVGVEWGFLLEG